MAMAGGGKPFSGGMRKPSSTGTGGGLEGRVAELERKVQALADVIAKLDERVQKIANSILEQALRA
jgi:hypothetical protein